MYITSGGNHKSYFVLLSFSGQSVQNITTYKKGQLKYISIILFSGGVAIGTGTNGTETQSKYNGFGLMATFYIFVNGSNRTGFYQF